MTGPPTANFLCYQSSKCEYISIACCSQSKQSTELGRDKREGETHICPHDMMRSTKAYTKLSLRLMTDKNKILNDL
jgi:hypothetical protein